MSNTANLPAVTPDNLEEGANFTVTCFQKSPEATEWTATESFNYDDAESAEDCFYSFIEDEKGMPYDVRITVQNNADMTTAAKFELLVNEFKILNG